MDNEMNKMELLKQITAAHFMVEDLHLYLNTHPMDRDALVKYNAFVMQYNMLVQTYEKQFGPLDEHSCSAFPFQWICEPWPWEYEANFKL
jgi:spore coat protein JB